jgi:sulfatase modifying factor 1
MLFGQDPVKDRVERRFTSKAPARAPLLFLGTTVCLAAGCNAIFGIQDHPLAADGSTPLDGSSDVRAKDSGTEAAAPSEGGRDSTVLEGSRDAPGCTPATQQCSGDGIETCESTGVWSSPLKCATGSCSGDACTGGTTGITDPSCATGWLANSCGGSTSCCTSLEVPGGTFYRSYDAVTFKDNSHPATISGFRLDEFPVVVGRFRQFITAVVGGWVPTAESGKHVHLNAGKGLQATGGGYESGWDSSWPSLPTSATTWSTNLKCGVPYDTWSDTTGIHDDLPINCLTWYEAYAFCIWDGGFLPSEAEWNYAAAGGGGSTGQRAYPWSSPPKSPTIDCSFANYAGDADGGLCTSGINAVGSESPRGDGAFGQVDLGGNVAQWTLDGHAAYLDPCTDCANLTATSSRVVRGGGYDSPTSWVLASNRGFGTPANRDSANATRCARTP